MRDEGWIINQRLDGWLSGTARLRGQAGRRVRSDRSDRSGRSDRSYAAAGVAIHGLREREEMTLPIVVQASRLPVKGMQAGRPHRNGESARSRRLSPTWPATRTAGPSPFRVNPSQ